MTLETERLVLRELTHDDAAFIVDLLNQPSFLRFIGDRGVRNEADARAYLDRGPIASYRDRGFGFYLVATKAEPRVALGICGLVKRDTLPEIDVGFAFLPQYWGRGYAFEAARAVMTQAKDELRLSRVLAITDPENVASIRLLEKLGLRFERMVKLGDDPTELRLFTLDL